VSTSRLRNGTTGSGLVSVSNSIAKLQKRWQLSLPIHNDTQLPKGTFISLPCPDFRTASTTEFAEEPSGSLLFIINRERPAGGSIGFEIQRIQESIS